MTQLLRQQETLVIDDGRDSSPTPALQRVVQRAVLHVQGRGRDAVTGGDLLMAMFDEAESPAVWLLGEQGMTQQDVANFIVHLRSQGTQRRRIQPVVVSRSNKRGRTGGKGSSDVSYWHETDLPRCPQFGRYRAEIGRSRVSSAMQLVVVSFPPKRHVLRSLANTAH
jgi:ATP-dependent Clp protease ATP-binding subunit ClpA